MNETRVRLVIRKILVVIGILLLNTLTSFSQDWQGLYQGRIPGNVTDTMQQPAGADGYTSSTQPGIQVFLPPKDKANATAVLIFPGGAYSFLSWTGEGTDIAQSFTQRGITCFIVKYRLPGTQNFVNRQEIPLADAVAAMRWVKSRSEVYGLDSAKVGVIGFSAGGHLAATLGNLAPKDARPAFSILVYPVVSMQPGLTHQGSHDQLLGKAPSKALESQFSAELQVNSLTPPTYMVHPTDDQLVSVENSVKLYEALVKNKIPAELHTPQKGDHGFIFGIPPSDWIDPIFKWLALDNFVSPKIDGKGKTVILTFDDASQSHYSNVPAMLKPYSFGATFYVCEFPPDFQDSTKYMNWRQIKALSDMGYEIGNHTWHHKGVSGLPVTKIDEEISYIDAQCRKWGIPKPTSFCYPGYGTDSACLPILKKYHYLTARTGGDRPWDIKQEHPYYVPAFTITGSDPAYFYKVLAQATTDNAIVFCVHGVPDNAHEWVTTPPELFKSYMKYLYDQGFTVMSMRQYCKKMLQ